MNDSQFNPMNPSFLLSESLDRELSGEERRLLEAHLRESDQLQLQRRQTQALHGLLCKWAAEPVEIDWASHRSLICERIRLESADLAELAKVDALLSQWAESIQPVDLRQKVMARIMPRRRVRISRILRIGLPLAAAAAIAMAILPWGEPRRHGATSTDLTNIVVFVESSDGLPASSRSTVVFDRAGMIELGEDAADVGFILVGAAPTRAEEEALPL